MIKLITKICREAGDKLLAEQDYAVRVCCKGGGDFALNADCESQKLIVDSLQNYFPGIAIIAEEANFEADFTPPATFFTVDPLDGTFLYAHKCDEWGVLISYIEDNTPMVACVYLPAKNKLISVVKGNGAYINGKRLPNVCDICDKHRDNLFLGLDLHTRASTTLLGNLRTALHPDLSLIRSIGSAASATLEFVSGRSQAHLSCGGAKIWDFAPLILASEEIGAFCSTATGAPFLWDSIDMNIAVADTSSLHEVITETTRNWWSSFNKLPTA